MKTITSNRVSLYLLQDNEPVNITENNITIGSPVTSVIWDLNSSNVFLYTNVATPPSDWTGTKYIYDGTSWSSNSSYVAPSD